MHVFFLPPSDWILAFDFLPLHICVFAIPPSLNLGVQLNMVDWLVPVEAFLMHPIYFQIFAQFFLQSSPLNYLSWNVHTRVHKDYDDLFGFWPPAWVFFSSPFLESLWTCSYLSSSAGLAGGGVSTAYVVAFARAPIKPRTRIFFIWTLLMEIVCNKFDAIMF